MIPLSSLWVYLQFKTKGFQTTKANQVTKVTKLTNAKTQPLENLTKTS